jgi:hypothetical protein
MPSADGVLVAAIELVLAGAGLPRAAVARNGHAPGTGFLTVRVAGSAYPRTAITWYEDGKSTGDPDAPAGRLRDCEQTLLKAGFHVEFTTETTSGCLLAWRRTRTR